jgi:hypothetical protein
VSLPRIAMEDEEMDSEPTCWCCGRHYPEDRLVRLGTQPEAAVCFQCAKFLHRRAREQNDVLRDSHGLAARGRVVFKTGREVVLRHGWQNGRFSGPVLRWIDKLTP